MPLVEIRMAATLPGTLSENIGSTSVKSKDHFCFPLKLIHKPY